MVYSVNKRRAPWQDRFHTPTSHDLLAQYPKAVAGLLDSARSSLAALSGVHERLAWQGIPWRWAFVYDADKDARRPYAYLIPDVRTPILAMPISSDIVKEIPARRLTRHVREGLASARVVNGVHWVTWDITSKTQLEELLALARWTHQRIHQQN